MKTVLRIALAGALSLVALTPGHAADNLIGKMNDTGGTAFSSRAYDIGADSSGRRIYVPAHALLDPTGAPFLTPANPGYFTLAGVVPLPIGAATDAKLEAVRALLAAALNINLPSGAATDAKVEAVRALLAGTLNINLPTGAALASRQAAPGTAGTPSADVLTMQGVLNGTPLPSDTVVRSTSADRGTILTGASQPLAVANPIRRGVFVQNKTTSDFNYNCRGLTAVDDEHNIRVAAGQAYETPPHHSGTGACNGIGASGGKLVFLEF